MQKKILNKLKVLALITFFVCLTGCEPKETPPVQPTNPAKQANTLPSTPGNELKIALTAAFVSESGLGIYQEITDYLGQKLGRNIELVTGLAYESVNEMLELGVLDGAFICGLPYVLVHDKPIAPIRLVAAPIMKDPRYNQKPIYYSDIIVHKDSPIKNFEELKGRSFAYNDEISNSGYNMPRHLLFSLGETNGYFSKVIRSGSHEESIRMVAEGQADASAIDSLILDYDRQLFDKYASQVRIIKTLGPAGAPPFVQSTKRDRIGFEKLQSIFLEMHKDPKGKKILDKALVARFEKVVDEDYNSIREMQQAAITANFLEIRKKNSLGIIHKE